MSEYQFCKVEREGRLTIVTINRPEAMNAINPLLSAELAAAFDDFASDPEQWVAILTGAGEKAFSAGNDLKFTAETKGGLGALPLPESGFGGITARWDLTKPIIAAVNGVALGGGFEIAIACDLIIASRNASFALPEVKVGLAALAGGLHRLPRQIGLKAAMGMVLTGRRVSAEEGLALGFVNEVTAPEDLMTTARKWAADIAAGSPMSVRASKAAIEAGLQYPSLQGAYEGQHGVPAMMASDDAREGPRAFAEKRAPVWSGR